MDACDHSRPYTLLIFLIGRLRSPPCPASDGWSFLRDYSDRATNVFLWISLIAVTALLLKRIAELLLLWARSARIPGPPSPSFFGHTSLVSCSGDLTGLLGRVHEKYGPVVKLWLGPQPLISLKDPTLIREVLKDAKDKLPSTGWAFGLGRCGLFSPSFKKVQKMRESLAMQLNDKLLDRAHAVPLKVIDCVMERIRSTMDKGYLDCSSFSQHMGFYAIGALIFGEGFLSWPKVAIYEELLMMIANNPRLWASYNIPPVWKRGFWRYWRLRMRLRTLTQDIISHCRTGKKISSQADQRLGVDRKHVNTDVDDVMAGSFLLEEFDGHLSLNEEPCGSIMGVMFHGCLTVSALFNDILIWIALHLDIQEKIYSEILAVCNGSAELDSHNVQRMHILLAVVYESARLLPRRPLLQRCSLGHDLNLKTGVTLPAKALYVIPVQLVHTDNIIWGDDACQFNPYRFLSKDDRHTDISLEDKSDLESVKSFTVPSGRNKDPVNSSFVLNDPNDNAAFLPFGSGSRACIGQRFSILSIATLCASLLQLYEIRIQPGSVDNPKPTTNTWVFQPLPTPKIAFVRRAR
ncbi:Cytochrome P450 [Acorus gramineus]|uniref:Cytochrome P450 n=1 Tax=Acorus gramineus TaxID=55184 RepID=A0AAV9BLA9_ACOGR|nr:Cytochrome P450 [Acorus gramineus]